ncbi:MAG: hypothetical protein ABIZ07_03365, partial [Dermatophilaceae bacterium]
MTTEPASTSEPKAESTPTPTPVVDPAVRTGPDRAWVAEAIRTLQSDATRTSDTHLLKVHL